jgi:hypothetical protein
MVVWHTDVTSASSREPHRPCWWNARSLFSPTKYVRHLFRRMTMSFCHLLILMSFILRCAAPSRRNRSVWMRPTIKILPSRRALLDFQKTLDHREPNCNALRAAIQRCGKGQHRGDGRQEGRTMNAFALEEASANHSFAFASLSPTLTGDPGSRLLALS